MSTHTEGIVAIIICFTVLNATIIGIAIYYVYERTERSKEEGVKIMFLVNNLIEILNDKYGEDKDTGSD